MAWTRLSRVVVGGPGSSGSFSFYTRDSNRVTGQLGAVSTGYLKVFFQGDYITVRAAKDAAGRTLDILALPCPPQTPPRSFEDEEKF